MKNFIIFIMSTVCLILNATVYEPFAPIDNSLPSDVTWNQIYNETQSIRVSNNYNVIGGGRVYFCPHCGAALDPEDYTELVKRENGNVYEDTGRKHTCILPLNSEYVLLILIILLLVTKLFYIKKKMSKK